MNILIENPPEWIMTGCLSKFRVDVSHTLWTYGDVLYNPGGTELPDHIIEHEEKHCDQQTAYPGGKDEWWRRFLTDAAFRVEQEAEAYGMQYRYICSQKKDRNERNRWLVHLTGQLSGPLYQSAIKPNDARALILKYAKV